MSSPGRSWQSPAPWQPSADVYRTRDGWVLKFDLAGVRADEVTVSIRGRRVCVSGVRRDTVVEDPDGVIAPADRREGAMPNADVRYPQLDTAAAFICTGGACSAPIFEPAQVAGFVDRLAEMQR